MNDSRTQDAAAPAPAHSVDGGRGQAGAAGEKPMACHIGYITPHRGKPFVTVEVWNKHVRIKRSALVVFPHPHKRGKINGLSARAGRRLRWAIENTPELMAPGALFIGLTYPDAWPRDGRLVKRHLDTLGKRVRRLGACFAWALEYQTRGAPHFHLIARFPDDWDIVTARERVASTWFEVVNSGDEKHLRAGTSVSVVQKSESAGWYIANYVSKKGQKTVPQGVTLPGRMWGLVGCRPPKPEVIRFREDDREGIQLIRNIRRWASSDFAFRQRTRMMGKTERKWLAGACDYETRKALLDFKNIPVTAEVCPKDRKSWSPHDAGREKGFSVRNAARTTRIFIEDNNVDRHQFGD